MRYQGELEKLVVPRLSIRLSGTVPLSPFLRRLVRCRSIVLHRLLRLERSGEGWTSPAVEFHVWTTVQAMLDRARRFSAEFDPAISDECIVGPQ